MPFDLGTIGMVQSMRSLTSEHVEQQHALTPITGTPDRKLLSGFAYGDYTRANVQEGRGRIIRDKTILQKSEEGYSVSCEEFRELL